MPDEQVQTPQNSFLDLLKISPEALLNFKYEQDPSLAEEESKIRKRLSETPEDRQNQKYLDYMKSTYGYNPEGKNSKMRSFWTHFAEVAKAISEGKNYKNPMDRVRPEAEKDYALERPALIAQLQELQKQDNSARQEQLRAWLQKGNLTSKAASTQAAITKSERDFQVKSNQNSIREKLGLTKLSNDKETAANKLQLDRWKAENPSNVQLFNKQFETAPWMFLDNPSNIAGAISDPNQKTFNNESLQNSFNKLTAKKIPSSADINKDMTVRFNKAFVGNPDGTVKEVPTTVAFNRRTGEFSGENILGDNKNKVTPEVAKSVERFAPAKMNAKTELASLNETVRQGYLKGLTGPLYGNHFTTQLRNMFGENPAPYNTQIISGSNTLFMHVKALASGRPSNLQIQKLQDTLLTTASTPENYYKARASQYYLLDYFSHEMLGNMKIYDKSGQIDPTATEAVENGVLGRIWDEVSSGYEKAKRGPARIISIQAMIKEQKELVQRRMAKTSPQNSGDTTKVLKPGDVWKPVETKKAGQN